MTLNHIASHSLLSSSEPIKERISLLLPSSDVLQYVLILLFQKWEPVHMAGDSI